MALTRALAGWPVRPAQRGVNPRKENTTMKIQDMYQFIADQAEMASAQWFKRQSADNYAAQYLYYRTGELAVFTSPPEGEGWKLGSGERLHAGLSRQQVARKIQEMAKGLPFLPIEV
jgi:hypothetical protein